MIHISHRTKVIVLMENNDLCPRLMTSGWCQAWSLTVTSPGKWTVQVMSTYLHNSRPDVQSSDQYPLCASSEHMSGGNTAITRCQGTLPVYYLGGLVNGNDR
ncbi:hypothetical protein RRG08_047140 [Elysia crispata]|uniref:Uncharacterized protein n=1 Tax=Elysia crispata TaxID=231223 RepID=A0AAE1AR63_9GAST|nr:hypothetical protein RRG08_047140 [Elysia crispata]